MTTAQQSESFSKSIDRRKSLLFTLKASQVDNLIVDRSLSQGERGCEFHYIIDTHDIISYCFPLGLGDKVPARSNIYLVADKQVALTYFFKENAGRIYYLKEYYSELRNLKQQLVEIFLELEQGWRQEAKKFEKAVDETWKQDDLIGENLSVFTALRISAAGGHINFNKLLEGNIILEDSIESVQNRGFLETPKSDDHDKLLQIIYSQFSFATDRTERYYIQQYEEYLSRARKTNPLGYYEFVTHQKETDQRNALLDAMAIKRVFDLNTHYERLFKEGEVSKRQIFLYLSSADRSDRAIKNLKNKWPLINGEPYNVLRDDAQLFAQLVMKNVNEYNHLHTLVNTTFEITNKELVDLIESERNRFENYNLLHDYSSIIGQNLNIDYKHFNHTTNQYIKAVKALIQDKIDEANESMAMIQNAWIKLDQYENYQMMINATSSTFDTWKSKRDPIESLKQRLPVVFDYRDMDPVVMASLIQILREISYFFTLRAPTTIQANYFREALTNFLKDYPAESEPTSLVMFLLGFVLPLPAKVKSDQDTVTFNHISIALELRSSDLIHRSEKSNDFEKIYLRELKHIQVWAGRRCQKYEEVYRLSKKYIKEFPEDPRFYHSLCLVLVSWNLDFAREVITLKPTASFEDAAKAAEMAIILYRKNFERDIPEALHSIEALHAGVAQLYASSALKFNEFGENVEKMNYHFDELTKILPKNEIRKYPEYCVAEALVELVRAEQLMIKKPMPAKDIFEKLKRSEQILRKVEEDFKSENLKLSVKLILARIAETSGKVEHHP